MKISVKAQQILKDKGIAKIDDKLFQIRSGTNPDKSYFVSKTTGSSLGWECECIANRNFKRKCCHIECVKVKTGEAKIDQSNSLEDFL